MKLSFAHEKSAFAVIDPAYSVDSTAPEPDIRINSVPWIYGRTELLCWRLKMLRRNTKDAALKVGYPGEFHEPYTHVFFRHVIEAPMEFSLKANGSVKIRTGTAEIYQAAASSESHNIVIGKDLSYPFSMDIEVDADGDLPAILVENGPVATNDNSWQWSNNGINWEDPEAFPQTISGSMPHQPVSPEIRLQPESEIDGFYDFGREIFGTVEVEAAERPEIAVGESVAEASSFAEKDREQSVELVEDGTAKWKSRHPLAFRFVKLNANGPSSISCRACFYPVRYRGAFACSDEALTRTWMNGAYTLRLCMQDFMLDGIKRDRLPWVGDLAMSTLADAFAFGNAEIVRRTLSVLARAGIEKAHLNGIVDYSLWWIITHDYFQRYFGDIAYLRQEWPRIKDILAGLKKRCDADGLLTVGEKDWLFIDWIKGSKLTTLQILWQWALHCAARLAERLLENDYAAELSERAEKLSDVLYEKAWDVQGKFWRGTPGDEASEISRHANFFSVLSGLADPDDLPSIRNVLLGKTAAPAGTPYMSGFENIALSRLGACSEMMSRVKNYWGGMLERGATTFWEAFDPEQRGDEAYSFYGRRFGKSLCHAWSSGPTAFLPMSIFGLEPLEDGWRRFALEPHLGSLDWATATVPVPDGAIEITVEKDIMHLSVPAGCVAEFRGRELRGVNDIPEIFK